MKKIENEALSLTDSIFIYTAIVWAITLTYMEGTMSGSINGYEELLGRKNYLQIGGGPKLLLEQEWTRDPGLKFLN